MFVISISRPAASEAASAADSKNATPGEAETSPSSKRSPYVRKPARSSSVSMGTIVRTVQSASPSARRSTSNVVVAAATSGDSFDHPAKALQRDLRGRRG
jgi:hypothetical protein